MDHLKFGATELNGSVYQTTARVAGRTVPALEITVEGAISEEALQDMQSHPLEILGAEGALQGKQEGYTTLIRHSVILACPTDAERELAQVRKALSQSEKEAEQLERENAELLFQMLTGEGNQ